jgi:hypothetical protein
LFGHYPMVPAAPMRDDSGRPALHWCPIGDR